MWLIKCILNLGEQVRTTPKIGTEEAVEEQFKSTENFGHTQTV